MTSPEAPALPLPRGRRRVVTGGILLGMFLGALEATVMGTAMPTVVAQLGGLEHYSWVFTAYVLASTATVPVWGRLSDLHGRRRVYLQGMAVFVAGSALAGQSESMLALVTFRAVQGLGAGAIVPVGLTMIGEIYTPAERARVQAVFSAVWGFGSIVGPLLGGWLTDALSWRWVFYMNLPFGLGAALVLGTSYAEGRRGGRLPVDWAGAALLCLAVAAFLAGLSGLTTPRWPWFAVSALTGLGFRQVERAAREPILPLDLLRHRDMAAVTATAFLVGMAIFGSVAFIPLFVRGVFGGSATEAGTTLTPLMLGWVAASTAAARLMIAVGSRPTVLAGAVMMAAAFALLARVGPGTPRPTLLAEVALLGGGTGLAMLTLLLCAQRLVGRERLGLATSLNLFARSIGGAVGVAMMGAIFTAGLPLPAAGGGAADGPSAAPGAPGSAREGSLDLGIPGTPAAFAAALRPVFVAGLGMAVAGFLVATRLGRAVRGGGHDEARAGRDRAGAA